MEATLLQTDYRPRTVNTDGWYAAQNAWKILFKGVFVIECFSGYFNHYLKVF